MRVILSVAAALAWMVLAADPVSSNCSSGYFECPYTGSCIPNYKVCDGNRDCNYYGEDEDNCYGPTYTSSTITPSSSSACSGYECQYDGRCIPESWVCDGFGDCPYYHDDEYNCASTTEYTSSTITPSSSSACSGYECQYDGRCIPESWVCDGFGDCPYYHDDEYNCASTTEYPLSSSSACSGYECQYDGRCIPESWVCDGFGDCPYYHDDEYYCASTTEYPLSSSSACSGYECQYDGRCIPESWVCDGYGDCPYYHDDEYYCASTTEYPTSSGCPDSQYECQNDGKCIPESWVCDGDRDCPIYGDDEHNCFTHDYSSTTTTTTATTTELVTFPPPTECKSPFDYIYDRCVLVDPFTSNSWDEARYLCQKFDSDLVVLDDFNFYGKLLQYINSRGIDKHDYWVGARDQQEGVWRWLDSTPVHDGAPLWALYGCTNDYNLEPRPSEAGEQDCGYLDTNRGLYMSDASCDQKFAAICQDQRFGKAEDKTKPKEPRAIKEVKDDGHEEDTDEAVNESMRKDKNESKETENVTIEDNDKKEDKVNTRNGDREQKGKEVEEEKE